MNDSPAALAAPFASPLSPIDMVPAIRWAFVEAGTSAHLVEVMHYREDGGSFRMHHTVVTAERNGRSWEIDTHEGEDLDYASLDLLAADLTRERAGRPCFCRIDECDMASERDRIKQDRFAPASTATRAASFSDDHASGAPVEAGALSSHATLADHDWDSLRRDGFMAAYVANGDGKQLVLDCRTCTECRKSFSKTVTPTTEAAFECLRAEGLI